MIWLCITALLSFTQVTSDQNIDTSRIRVFPAENQSIAGVFQVSRLNDRNQPEYSFNASEARWLCSSLGVKIASKAQLQEALTRGLETCRYGWIDEHYAVIPRINALINCGQNQKGLVPWRALVTKEFDVFCFNESDAATQLKDATTDSPLNRSDYSRQTQFPSKTSNPTWGPPSTLASPLTPKTIHSEAQPAGVKAILITLAFAFLLTAIIIFAYMKMRSSCVLSSDMKQQQENIQTEEWTCVKDIKETKTAAQKDEKIEVEDNAS
ncbi:lymphatic vessel endothelial hyaluronic acid receptor 1a [Spinachia spinachia]